MDESQESFEERVHTILEYEKYSGLAMNFEKTKVVWFGCENPPDVVYLPNIPFEWNPNVFTVLCFDFTVHLNNI